MLTEIIDEAGCGGIVAYTYRRWDVFETMDARDTIFPNGISPKQGDDIVCYSCRRRITNIHELAFGRSIEGATTKTFEEISSRRGATHEADGY